MIDSKIETFIVNEYQNSLYGKLSINLLHDLTSPISSLKNIFAILEQSSITKEEKEIINIGNNALMQLTKIVAEFKEIYPNNKRLIGSYYLKEIVAETSGIIKAQLILKNISLLINIPANLLIVGNKGDLKKILFSLLLNLTNSQNNVIELRAQVKHNVLLLTVKSLHKIEPSPEFTVSKKFVETIIKDLNGKAKLLDNNGDYTGWQLKFIINQPLDLK